MPSARHRDVTARRPPTRPRPPAAYAPRAARRLGVCSALLILGFGLLAARVGQLQLANGAKYKQLSVDLALHKIPLTAQRGSVFDRNGRDLAMSIELTTVYADPTLVTDPIGEAAKLARVLPVSEDELGRALANKGTPDSPRHFAYLAHAVSDRVAAAVHAMKLPGIGFVPESARSYPAGSVAAAVIGRVRSDGPGLDGVEREYDSLLAGKSGELVVEQDPLGHDIPDTQRTQVDAQRGTDVVLTIDEDLQWQAEYSLLDQVQGDRREERHGGRDRRHQRRCRRDGDRARRDRDRAGRGRGSRRHQRAAHRPVRTRLDEQAHHAVVGARARPRRRRARSSRFRTRSGCRARSAARTPTPSRTSAPSTASSTGRRPTSSASRRTSARSRSR